MRHTALVFLLCATVVPRLAAAQDAPAAAAPVVAPSAEVAAPSAEVAAPSAEVAAPPAAPTQAPAPTALDMPPDIVRFKNGAMVRGLITEYVPGDHVDLKLVTGESKRYSAADVAYAGSAREDAAPPARAIEPPIVVKGQRASIHFEAAPGETEPLTLYANAGSGRAYGPGGMAIIETVGRLCTAPCDAEVVEGTHGFSLQRGNGSPVPVADAVSLSGPTTLVGHYESHRARMIALFVASGALLVTGIGILASSDVDHPGKFGAGFGMATAGILLCFPAIWLGRDGAHLDVNRRPAAM